MKLNIVAYITIILLVVIILLQNKSCKREDNIQPIRIDTVVRYDTIKKIVPGKTVFIKQKIDTSVWIKKVDFKPDTTYKGLLKQYENLGNQHFAINVFKTDFQVADYGTLTVIDSVQSNWLIKSTLETNLTIPTTTITIEKESPPKLQLYSGFHITGSKYEPLSGVYGDLSLKTKNDKLYNVSLGYNGQIQYGFGIQWKLKIK